MKKLFLSSVIALGLVACSDSNESVDNGGGTQAGNTYTSVEVTLGNGLRAASQTDNPGTANEQKLNDLLVLSSKGDQNFAYLAAAPADPLNADGKFWTVSDKYTTSAWKTTPGSQMLALLFNVNGATTGTAATTKDQVFEGWSTELSPVGNLTMSSKAFLANVKPNITKEIATNGSTEADNVFSGVEVERVVAKGIVRLADNVDYNVKDESDVAVITGKISKVKFAAVNGAKKTYLYRDNAGERTMETADPNKYLGFTSAIDALTPIKDAVAADAAGLVRLGAAGVPVEIYDAKEVNAAGADITDEATKAFYFFENSGDFKNADNMKSEGYYRFAYAKVYAVFTPTSLLAIDEAAPAKLVAKAGTGRFYKEKAAADGGGYILLDEGDDTTDATEGYLVWQLKEITDIAEGTDFYRGETDGILYASYDAAISSQYAPNQKAFKYEGGKCGYRTLWNRQTADTDPSSVVNADVRRNNTYLLTISKFAKLGFPWDESDPNDPNLPKPGPEDPRFPEPEDPTDPNIEPGETYMRVIAEVLQWNLVTREDVDLH